MPFEKKIVGEWGNKTRTPLCGNSTIVELLIIHLSYITTCTTNEKKNVQAALFRFFVLFHSQYGSWYFNFLVFVFSVSINTIKEPIFLYSILFDLLVRLNFLMGVNLENNSGTCLHKTLDLHFRQNNMFNLGGRKKHFTSKLAGLLHFWIDQRKNVTPRPNNILWIPSKGKIHKKAMICGKKKQHGQSLPCQCYALLNSMQNSIHITCTRLGLFHLKRS